MVVTHIVLDRHAQTGSFDVSCAEVLLLETFGCHLWYFLLLLRGLPLFFSGISNFLIHLFEYLFP